MNSPRLVILHPDAVEPLRSAGEGQLSPEQVDALREVVAAWDRADLSPVSPRGDNDDDEGFALARPYCGRGNHLYIDIGAGPMTCRRCGHVKGRRRRKGKR